MPPDLPPPVILKELGGVVGFEKKFGVEGDWR